jgi:hypothetical protein
MPYLKRVGFLVAFFRLLIVDAVLSRRRRVYFPTTMLISQTRRPKGMHQKKLVDHIRREIVVGLRKVRNVQWLRTWQVLVTLKMTADEQNGFTPRVSLLTPKILVSQSV